MSLTRARLLFVSASPYGQEPLDHAEERVAIREALSGIVDRVVLLPDQPQASRSSVISTLDRQRPQILHISCHGGDKGLILQDEFRNPVAVPPAWLVGRVQATPTIRLVLLSACVSAGHAEMVAAICGIDAIGFRGYVAASDARNFSRLFYSLLARGHSVSSAYRAAAEVSEAVAADSVWAGAGTYRLPRPGRAWGLLGVAALGLAVGFAAIARDPIEPVEGATTGDVVPPTATETAAADASTTDPTEPPTVSTTPDLATATTGTTATEAEPATMRSTPEPSTTTGRRTTTTAPPPRGVSQSELVTRLRKALDDRCRGSHPDDASELEVTNDDGVLRVRAMYEVRCPPESLCGCSKRVLERQRFDNLDFEFTRADIHYNAAPTAPQQRLDVTWR